MKQESDFALTVAEEPADDDILVPDAAPVERRPLETLPTIGHIGRYALKYRLGEGGIGTVYAAHDPLLSRAVAVKTLHVDEDIEGAGGAEPMLLHEARAAALLSHNHIVTLHDAGTSDGSVYLAMEMLHGRDLRALLARGWRPSVRQAALIVRRIAEALAYAHGKGVVHCDIKPANIFMVGRTSPKVLDFGIARVAQRPNLDTRSLAGGSPYYMAPEQIRGEAVDRRCDVYSLGAVLYELLTGRRAHLGATLDEIADAVLHRVPAAAHAVNPRVPAALSAIVAKAMAKNVEERHRSARQLARELRVWLGEEIPRRRRVGRLARARGRGLALAGVAAVAGAVALAAAGSWWMAPSGDEVVAAASPMQRATSAIVAPAAPVDEAMTRAVSAIPTPGRGTASAGAQPPARATASVGIDAPRPAPRNANVATDDVIVAAGPAGGRAKAAKPSRKATTPAGNSAPAAAAPPAPGVLQLAISPWGEVEIDGAPAGTTPPLSRLDLPAGRHTVVVRNADFPPYRATVEVSADQPAVVRHRFGS